MNPGKIFCGRWRRSGGLLAARRSPPTAHRSLLTAYFSPAFTLIEMLTVLVIISILASMVFAVVLYAQRWMREKRAMMEIKSIELAIKTYHARYGKWPNQTQLRPDFCYYTDNAIVIAALTSNPGHEVVLQFQLSSLSTNPANRGSFLDPWQRPYVIIMDENDDNRVTFDNITNVVLTNLSGKVTTNDLNFSVDVEVGVLSWGELNANLSGSYNMDLCSWQSGSKTK
jgi:prepilin-type N-terminal cleavage/methylation domain-containing protein